MGIEWPAHGLRLQARIDDVSVDYAALVASAKLVIDTRNACGKAGIAAANIVRA